MLNLKNNNSSAKQIDSNVEYNSPFIFTKKINTNYKLVPFNIVENDVGKTKYLPPVSKEWKNTVYNYSPKNNINYPIYDLNINSLIRGYFSLYFNNKFLQHKYISRRTKRKSLNRIFVSKAEIKHTNEKAIITLYVFNKERLSLLKRIQKIKKILGFGLKNRISFMTDKWMNFLSYVSKESKSSNLIDTPLHSSQIPHGGKKEERGSESINNSLSLLLKFNVNDSLRKINFLYYMRNKRFFKKVKKVFSTFRRLKLKLSLNKYKFEEKFLSKLSQSISKYYGKKVEFNIVNLKSIAYNTDIFTEILTIKLRKLKSSPMRRINSLLSKVALPKVNTIIERGRVEKQVDRELIDNKYRNININHILNKLSEQDINSKDNLNKLLYNIYYKTILDNSNDTMESIVPLKTKNSKDNISSFSSGDLNKAYYSNLRNIIFENIKYKAMGGARLIVKGRLTKRYRADRAVYKLKWKGGLKNIDSSFKGLSAVVFRGYMDSNVEKSRWSSKRRIGSFAVRGWFSGK
uniref:Ribosomal protein S3 n=1 Tax=Apiospora arundinis TaxID=335852 RepID=A0A220IDB7_9PEZI|nr:ribosomal protein S3 [Apiospora arundinis]ASH96116.1 ribosomal protein S3 [Apiospora arundinis]